MILADKLREMVKEECKKPTNPFSYVAFIHISETEKHAISLAKELGADEEICRVAALLHDWGSIIGRYKNHHIVGSEESERILREFDYPQDKIEQVKHCILTHRGSRELRRETLEAEILASADAMSHFTTVDTLFNMVYNTKEMNYEEGRKFVREKLQRDWKKLMPKAKELMKKYYEVLMDILK